MRDKNNLAGHLALVVSAGTILGACSSAAQVDNSEPASIAEPAETTNIDEPGTPLGMTLRPDGITYLGVATIDITPEIIETFDDVNGNSDFDGCFDEPSGENCTEGFDDVNGNGIFDAVFMGGFNPLRPAQSIGSPITTRAFVMSHNATGTEPTKYVAWVVLDLIGLEGKRFWTVEDTFVAEGFFPGRLVVTSTHNHQGPDTIGLWGSPEELVTGLDNDYQERVTASIEEAVRIAAAAMQPVTLKVAEGSMEDHSPYFSGAKHGGLHPMENVRGMLNDIRDPRLISDRLLIIQASHLETNDTVLTLTSWAGHPEVGGGDQTEISAEWVGISRNVLEETYGGTAIHLPEALGGMQSALFIPLPLVSETGVEQFQPCTEEELLSAKNLHDCFGKDPGSYRLDVHGKPVPQWAPKESAAVITSHGWHFARSAIRILKDAENLEDMYLDVDTEALYVPVDNPIYNLVFSFDILDLGYDDMVTDETLCIETGDAAPIGCSYARVFRIRMGPVEFLTAPGEVTPELAWGLPTSNAQFTLESENLSARGPDALYFVQHKRECDHMNFQDCNERKTVDGCDCLSLHASPYKLSHNDTFTPVLEFSQAKYRAMVSMTDSYFSYVLPGPDIHHDVNVLDDYQGDHFEDTVTFSTVFADKVFEAHRAIDGRW